MYSTEKSVNGIRKSSFFDINNKISSKNSKRTENRYFMPTPVKSVTFHGLQDLRTCRILHNSPGSANISSVNRKDKLNRLHSQPISSRKRSLFFEMGERIRLFSTSSFVSPAIMGPSSSDAPPTVIVTHPKNPNLEKMSNSMTKSHSLNSFEDCIEPVFVSARCPSSRSREKSTQSVRMPIGSLLSLQSHQGEMVEVDMEKGLEKDVSQLGILCHHCSTTDLACPKIQKELPSPSVSSVYSLARSDLSNEPLCRICHCCWPPDSNDPLISPCRCSGSLQYVHVSCLMHWLDISSRKLHRPAICELCLYKYRRRRVLKYREMKLPHCATSDIRYYTLFVVAILMMILSAVATIVCFQLEKTYGLQGSRRTQYPTLPDLDSIPTAPISTSSSGDITTVAPVIGRKRPDISSDRRDDTENILSTVTLIAAMVFFLSFFLGMYAHVKSGLSFCGYLTLCWSSNLEWSIEEYKHSRDTQYLNKLEELRRKINEKQKKAADEIEPLRSSVIVLE